MNIRKLTYTALMIAVGILLPQIFHMLGGTAAGGTFLPMHIRCFWRDCCWDPCPARRQGFFARF